MGRLCNHDYRRNDQTILVSHMPYKKVNSTLITVPESQEKHFDFFVIVICKAVNSVRTLINSRYTQNMRWWSANGQCLLFDREIHWISKLIWFSAQHWKILSGKSRSSFFTLPTWIIDGCLAFLKPFQVRPVNNRQEWLQCVVDC